jgi:hypothetical protein
MVTVTDEDIQRQWQKIRRLGLAQMSDGGYVFAATSPSTDTKVPNVDLFVSRKMSKQETYQHLTEIYDKVKSCPITGKRIVKAPSIDEVFSIKKFV